MADAVIKPLALTAFYCCALRAKDAASARPVCGDNLAAKFLDDDTLAKLQPALAIRGLPPAMSRAIESSTTSCGPLSRRAQSQNHSARCRPGHARLPHERRAVVEFDDAALFAFKEAQLPEHTAPNKLTRTSVDFSRAELHDYLAPLAGDDEALVVLEGVSMCSAGGDSGEDRRNRERSAAARLRRVRSDEPAIPCTLRRRHTSRARAPRRALR